MSKTILASILGVCIIAYVVISNDLWELGANKSDLVSPLEQGQIAIANQEDLVNDSTQIATGPAGKESQDINKADAELLEAVKTDSDEQKPEQEANEKVQGEKLKPSAKILQTRKSNPGNNDSNSFQSNEDIEKDLDTKVITLSGKASDVQSPSALSLGLSTVSKADEGKSSKVAENDGGQTGGENKADNNEANGNDSGETNNGEGVNNNPDEVAGGGDATDDEKEVSLVGTWTGGMETVASSSCENARMDMGINVNERPRTPFRYSLNGTVMTNSGFLTKNKLQPKAPYTVRGSATNEGVLMNVASWTIVKGFGAPVDYKVTFNGIFSETTAKGNWSDNRGCAGAWSLTKK